MRKKNLLLLSVTSIIGGGSEVVYTLAKSLSKSPDRGGSQFSVVVGCPSDGEYFQRMIDLGIDVYDLPLRNISAKNIISIIHICKKHHISLIHTHGKGAGLFGRLVGFLLRIPVVHSTHGFHFEHLATWLRNVYLIYEGLFSFITNKYLFVSEGERIKFLREIQSCPPEKTHVVYNGIDFSRFEFAPVTKADFGFNECDILIVTMARMCGQKGLEYLVQAVPYLQHLAGLNSNIKLIIAGDDLESEVGYIRESGYRNKVLDLIDRLQLDKVVVIRPKSHDVLRLVSVCDIYVSSALWEGFSLAIIEAMNLRLPIIATDVIGNNEAIVDGESGILVPPQNPKEIAVALNKIINDPENALRLAENGYRRARTHFTHASMIKNTIAVYELATSHA